MVQRSCEEICNLYKSELVHLFPLREIDNFIKIAFSKLNGWNKIDVSLNKSVFLDSESTKAHFELIERLKKNEPIQYILKETVFYELLIQVREGVLIPRCETEELVHWVLQSTKQNDNILDTQTYLHMHTLSSIPILVFFTAYESSLTVFRNLQRVVDILM